MESFDKELGTWMTAVREREGISQEAIAQQLGKDQPAISKIEHGQRRVTVDELLHWASVMGISMEMVCAELERLRRRHWHTTSIWEVGR